MRTYTTTITLLVTDAEINLSPEDHAALDQAGIAVPDEPIADLLADETTVVAVMKSGKRIGLDILYPAMGAHVRSELAGDLGAQQNESGCLFTDAHQRTTVLGLYAAGDLTFDLSQLSVATGQAAIAATDIHNSLPPNPR